MREQWAGPLPPPQVLAGFNEIVPGAAERILAEFEQEAAHRRQLENRQASIISRDLIIGQLAALLFAIGALAVAAYSASIGAQWIGSIVGGGTIAAVVLAFLKSRSSE